MTNKLIDFNKINSLIISFILMSPAFITFFNKIFSIKISNSSIVIFIVLLFLFVVELLFSNNMKINFPVVLTIFFMLFLYSFSYIKFFDLNYSIMQLGFYVLLPLIIGSQKINYEYIHKYNILLSIPLVFGLEKILILDNVGLNQANMYNTYCFIPSIISSLTLFFFYKGKKSIFIILGLLLNTYYFLRVGFTAVRGFWLVFIIYIFLAIYLLFQKKISKKKYFVLLLFTVLVLIIIFFYIDRILLFILNTIEPFFSKNPGFIIKTKRLISQGDLLNGRRELWGEALFYVFKNPIFGYGINSFRFLTNNRYPYPHNLFIQLILDCGIYAFYIIMVLLNSFKNIFNNLKKDYNKKVYLMYLFSIVLPILFFSNDIWKSGSLWLLVGISLSDFKIGDKNESDKKELYI